MSEPANNPIESAKSAESNNSAATLPAASRATVAAAFVRGMLAGARRAGHDPATLLAAVGIDPDCLADAGLRVPLPAYAALYNHVVGVLDDEAFGLCAQPMRGGSFEFLCRATLTAPQLDEALDRAARFLRVVLPDFAVAVQRDGSRARLEIRALGALAADRVFAFEWLLRLLHGLACWLVGRGIALDAVDFPYPRPAHADDYALIYTEQSRFAAGDTLAAHFAANLLELPVRRDEQSLQRFLDGAPGKLTTLYRRDRELVLRVRDCLRAALPESPDIEAVAAALRLSPRTLARRLEDEGSGFRAIKDALRRDLALARLAKTAQPVAAIAAELGFSDPSAFYRAFTGWTGVSPSQYRRRLQTA